MIGLFIKFLPDLLILYFLIRFVREPFFLVGIPFLFFFRYCIFFESVKIFWIAAWLGGEVLFLIWLVIFWAIVIIKFAYDKSENLDSNDYFKISGFNVMDFLIIGLMTVTIVGLFFVLKEYFIVDDVLTEFFTMMSLFIGYFIIKRLVRFANPDILTRFLFSIVVVNSIASLLYIFHQGLHIPIYHFEEEATDMIGSEVITRTFWFMPVLWFFSVSYLIVFRENKTLLSTALLVVNILAIFISYTRSFLILSVVIILLYYFLVGLKERDYGSIVKNFIYIGIAGIMFFVVVSIVLPAKTEFFMGRFKEIKKGSNDAETNTLLYRFARTGEVFDKIGSDKALLGFGPVTQSQLPWVEAVKATTSDLVWTGVVFRWGYVGLILFVSLYIVSIQKAYRLFMNSDGIISQLALLFLLVIISQVIEGFTAWTFLSPSRFALGLWYFGMFSALVQGVKNNELLTKQVLEND
jgi:hypothetical protein